MNKSVHSLLAKMVSERFKELRDEAGMTQRDLAAALGREHGMVARIDLGERRVDLAEAFWIFRALGADPAKEAANLMKRFETIAGESNPEK